MALIAVASVKGAPGVSTAALSLAATWPRRAMLAELDPDGGDLRYRLRAEGGAPLAPEPGLVSYAADVVGGADVLDHLQVLPGGLRVLVGVSSAADTDELQGRWAAVGALLDAAPDVDVIADCGRLHPYTPVEDLLPYARALLVLTRPTIDGVAQLRSRLRTLSLDLPVYVGVVSGAREPRSAREIQTVLNDADIAATVLGRVAYDPVGAGTIAGEWSGTLNSSALMRSARELGHQLARSLAELEASA
jgi:MinD-like ATPase involved in chromosome partitioning or flagellar assembly